MGETVKENQRMKYQTKESLTRKYIYDELVGGIKYAIIGGCLMLFVITVTMIPLGLFIYSESSDYNYMTAVIGTKIAGIVCIAVPIFCILAFLYSVFFGSLNKKYYENFLVVEDELTNLCEETVWRRTRRGRKIPVEEKVFYFYKHGRYRITDRDNSAFQYSDVGDTFYIVLNYGHVKQAYNAKIYRFVDTDNEDISSGFSTTTK
jgi:hypothetical protein